MPDPQRLTNEERSNLVAYLDQEIPEELSRSIAQKLSQSLIARHEADLLERTWKLLDYLPRPKASDELITRTRSLVTQFEQQGDRAYVSAASVARRAVLVAAGLALVGAAATLGYAAARWVWPNPTSRLVRDLSIAERLEQYQDVGTFEFLQMLDHSPHVFTADDP